MSDEISFVFRLVVTFAGVACAALGISIVRTNSHIAKGLIVMGDNFWFGYCLFLGILFVFVFSVVIADAGNTAQAQRCAASGLDLYYGARGTVCVDPHTHILYAPHASDD